MNSNTTKSVTPTKPEEKTQKLISFEKTLSDSVQNRVTTLMQQGRLDLPKDYSVGNALQSAWLTILETVDKYGKPALEVCTKESIANALFEMAVMGLNPAKKQGYFIVYGNKLSWFTSYFGKCTVIKRLKGVENEPIATLIYQGDTLNLTHNTLGEEYIIDHKTSWENKASGVIVGVYATVIKGGIVRSAAMTYAEVKEAWNAQNIIKNKVSDPAKDHIAFAGEFAKRTVLNRLVKMIANTSTDSDLLAETMIANESQHFDFEPEFNEVETPKQLEDKAKQNVASAEFVVKNEDNKSSQ